MELWLAVLLGTVLAPALRARACVNSAERRGGFGQCVVGVECI